MRSGTGIDGGCGPRSALLGEGTPPLFLSLTPRFLFSFSFPGGRHPHAPEASAPPGRLAPTLRWVLGPGSQWPGEARVEQPH